MVLCKREELCNEKRPTNIHIPQSKIRPDFISQIWLQIFQLDFELEGKQSHASFLFYFENTVLGESNRSREEIQVTSPGCEIMWRLSSGKDRPISSEDLLPMPPPSHACPIPSFPCIKGRYYKSKNVYKTNELNKTRSRIGLKFIKKLESSRNIKFSFLSASCGKKKIDDACKHQLKVFKIDIFSASRYNQDILTHSCSTFITGELKILLNQSWW